MAKTAKQIKATLPALESSTLYTMISVRFNGKVIALYSQLETLCDFPRQGSNRIQEGVVTCQLFVPDIDPFDNGVLVEDGERTEEMERLAQEWVDSLTCEV